MGSLKRSMPGKIQYQSGNSPRGYDVFKPEYQAELVKADYEGPKMVGATPDLNKCPAVYKVLPFIRDYDDDGELCTPFFDTYRHGPGLLDFNPFYFKVAIGTFGIGEDRRTACICDLTAQDPKDSLLGTMIRRIRGAIKKKKNNQIQRVKVDGKSYNPMDWDPLFGGEGVNFMNVAFPDLKGKRVVKYFSLVLPLYTDRRLALRGARALQGANAGDRPSILELSSSAGEAMEAELNRTRTGVLDASNFDFEDQFVVGDVTSFDTGKFMVVGNKSYHDYAKLLGDNAVSMSSDEEYSDEEEYDPNEHADDADGARVIAKYAVEFFDKVRCPVKGKDKWVTFSHSKLVSTIDQSVVLQNYRPIYDYFWLPETHEMALMIAKAFRSKPELLKFGFADEPEFWTDDVTALLASRAQIAVPGNTQDDASDDDDDDLDSDMYETDDEDNVGEDEESDDVAPPAATQDRSRVSTNKTGNTNKPKTGTVKRPERRERTVTVEESMPSGTDAAFLAEFDGVLSRPKSKVATKTATVAPPGTKKKKKRPVTE